MLAVSCFKKESYEKVRFFRKVIRCRATRVLHLFSASESGSGRCRPEKWRSDHQTRDGQSTKLDVIRRLSPVAQAGPVHAARRRLDERLSRIGGGLLCGSQHCLKTMWDRLSTTAEATRYVSPSAVLQTAAHADGDGGCKPPSRERRLHARRYHWAGGYNPPSLLSIPPTRWHRADTSAARKQGFRAAR